MDKFEDELHRGHHDDEFSPEDLAAIAEIAALTRGDADVGDDLPSGRSSPGMTMRSKRANQSRR